jgi:very-short-patch-repair endonuclease
MTQHKQPLWLTQYAKQLRKNMTEAEQQLWFRLRSSRLNGIKFRRQVPMSHYIADFVCSSFYLIIELDGSQHQIPEQKKYDQLRTDYFELLGYHVLRIDNNEIFSHMSGVIEAILDVIESRKEKSMQ